jgi:hypothetical protein
MPGLFRKLIIEHRARVLRFLNPWLRGSGTCCFFTPRDLLRANKTVKRLQVGQTKGGYSWKEILERVARKNKITAKKEEGGGGRNERRNERRGIDCMAHAAAIDFR